MNFAKPSKASAALQLQTPTYCLPPDFSTPPLTATSKGPLGLGTLVADLGRYRPLNRGLKNRVAIDEDELYTDVIEDFSTSVKGSKGGDFGVFSKILDQSIGGDVSLKGKRSSEDVFRIARLETKWFYPSIGYVKKCLLLKDVKKFNEMSDHKEPVYLITGLKTAWGATITTSRGSEFAGSLQGGAAAPAGVIDLGVGGNVGLSSEYGVTSSYGKPRDFVLGIQVQKIRMKKKSLFSKETVVVVENVKKGTVLYDDTVPVPDDDLDFDVELEDLTEGEIGGWERVEGKDAQGRTESWLLPSEML